mmetsp:Transcript_96255/g.241282  ORF Transcript_96255/g.241282 Transcript_96255/m.241282 type:complete len:286 (+) Transcript_96255:224-1081(+)
MYSEPGDAQAPHLHQDFKAGRQLPNVQGKHDDVKADVQSPRGLVALLHEGHAGRRESPEDAHRNPGVKVWAREELVGAEVRIADAVCGEEDPTAQQQGADLVVPVLIFALDQLTALLRELVDLRLQLLVGARGLCLRVLVLGQLLAQVRQLHAHEPCLPPLPTQEAGVKGHQEQQWQDDGVHQTRSLTLQWPIHATLRPSALCASEQRCGHRRGSGHRLHKCCRRLRMGCRVRSRDENLGMMPHHRHCSNCSKSITQQLAVIAESDHAAAARLGEVGEVQTAQCS